MLGGQNVFGSYLEKHHSKSESDNGSKEFGNKNEDANIHSKNPESEHERERYPNHDNNGYYTESSDFIELGVDVVFQCQSIPHICGSWQLPLPITYSVCSCGKTPHRQPGKPDVNMDSVKTESEGEVLVHEDRNKTGKGNKQDPSKEIQTMKESPNRNTEAKVQTRQRAIRTKTVQVVKRRKRGEMTEEKDRKKTRVIHTVRTRRIRTKKGKIKRIMVRRAGNQAITKAKNETTPKERANNSTEKARKDA